MQWLSENWIWVFIVVGMLAMHLFGHGGHGGHRGHGSPRDDAEDAKKQPQRNDPARVQADGGEPDEPKREPKASGHRH